MDDLLFGGLADVKLCTTLSHISYYTHNLEDVGGDFFFDNNEITATVKKLQNEKLALFHTYVRHGYHHGEQLVGFARNLETTLQKNTHKRLFFQSAQLVKNLVVFLPLTHTLSLALETRLRTALTKRGIKEPKLTEYLFLLSKPKKKNGPVLEAETFARLVAKAKKVSKADLTMELQRHADRFGYLGYREPFSPGWSVNFFQKRLQQELRQHHTKHEHPTVRIPVKLRAQERALVALLQEYVYFRNYRTEKLYEGLFYIEPLWRSLARKYRLRSENDLSYYFVHEVRELFDSGKKVSETILQLRKVGFAAVLHENKLRFLFGDEFKKRQLYHQKREQTAVSTLQGMSAQKGVVRGKVKVVLRTAEQQKVKKGDILVMTMTTPDYLSAMQRAAGFVTDEGGITCHAAIVAREMKKPCIIGTKIATKVLKDGDRVEVDAKKGIVRKLS